MVEQQSERVPVSYEYKYDPDTDELRIRISLTYKGKVGQANYFMSKQQTRSCTDLPYIFRWICNKMFRDLMRAHPTDPHEL